MLPAADRYRDETACLLHENEPWSQDAEVEAIDQNAVGDKTARSLSREDFSIGTVGVAAAAHQL